MLQMPAMNNIASIVAELKSERDRLDRAISALSGVSGNQRRSGKRKLSAAARAHIVQAQRERWRKFRAAEEGLVSLGSNRLIDLGPLYSLVCYYLLTSL